MLVQLSHISILLLFTEKALGVACVTAIECRDVGTICTEATQNTCDCPADQYLEGSTCVDSKLSLSPFISQRKTGITALCIMPLMVFESSMLKTVTLVNLYVLRHFLVLFACLSVIIVQKSKS